MGQELISSNENFDFVQRIIYSNEVMATHNVKYILEELKELNSNEEIAQPLSKNECEVLKKHYENYEQDKY